MILRRAVRVFCRVGMSSYLRNTPVVVVRVSMWDVLRGNVSMRLFLYKPEVYMRIAKLRASYIMIPILSRGFYQTL